MGKASLRTLLDAALTVRGSGLLTHGRALSLIAYAERRSAFPRIMEAWRLRDDAEILTPEHGLTIDDVPLAPGDVDCSADHMRGALKRVPVRWRRQLRFKLWIEGGGL